MLNLEIYASFAANSDYARPKNSTRAQVKLRLDGLDKYDKLENACTEFSLPAVSLKLRAITLKVFTRNAPVDTSIRVSYILLSDVIYWSPNQDVQCWCRGACATPCMCSANLSLKLMPTASPHRKSCLGCTF